MVPWDIITRAGSFEENSTYALWIHLILSQLKCHLAFQTRLYRVLFIFCVKYRCIAVQFMIMVRDSVEADITLFGQLLVVLVLNEIMFDCQTLSHCFHLLTVISQVCIVQHTEMTYIRSYYPLYQAQLDCTWTQIVDWSLISYLI